MNAQDPLNQIGALTQNPTGLPGASDTEQYVAQLEDEIQYQKELAEQQRFAYGVASTGMGRSPLPDERQMNFLFSTQPKQEDVDNSAKWDHMTIDETEILRHAQFGMYDEAKGNRLVREYADVQVLRQQKGKKRVAMNAAKKMYFKILLSKGVIHEGHAPAIEFMLNPSNKQEIKQSIVPYDSTRKPSGFWGFLGRK